MIKSILKNIITSSLLLLLCVGLYAQDQNPCATIMSDEQMKWLRDFQANPPADFKVAGETFYIPIQVHVLGDDNGNGYFAKSSILQMMCDVNTDFEDTNGGMQFFLNNNEFIYHNDSDVYVHDVPQDTTDLVYDFFFENNLENVVNVYMVFSATGACGYYAPYTDNVVIVKSCADLESTTLTHELGHFFSLPHTFRGWENGGTPNDAFTERAARTGPTANCNFAGDGFCDTGADYVADRWSCPYAELTDPDGVPFTPDSSIYMSYSNDACQSRFSGQQIEAMQANLLFSREELLDYNQELVFDDIRATQIYYPVGGSNVPADEVLLQWEPIEGASFYQVRVTNFAIGYDYDEFVEGNSITLENLQTQGLYVWSIKPFNDGNYCVPVASGSFNPSVVTALSPAVLEVNPPTCDDSEDGNIYIEVQGGNGPYIYTWEDGTEGQTRENLPSGTYAVTIYDSGSDLTETIEVEIDDPTSVAGEVTQTTNGQIEVDVIGGVAPYSVTWPNEATDFSTSDLVPGTNTLYIEDAFGCNTEVEFEVIDIELQVYNPTCLGEVNGQWEVVDVLGGTPPYTYYYEGQSLETPLLGELEAGVYQIEVRDNAGNGGFFDIEISIPDALSISIANDGAELTSYVSGGMPPYLVQWELSDGTQFGTTLDLDGILPGIYSGMITDGGNCTKEFSFFVQEGTGLTEIANGSINLFPNPVSSASSFYLELNLLESTAANLKIYNNIGKEVLEENKNLTSGKSQWSISTGKWASGLYFVHLEMENGNKVIQKLIIE